MTNIPTVQPLDDDNEVSAPFHIVMGIDEVTGTEYVKEEFGNRYREVATADGKKELKYVGGYMSIRGSHIIRNPRIYIPPDVTNTKEQ